MTKTGSTKNSILNLLSKGNKTLSDISSALNLAPSTVSQHLDELEDMGAIRELKSDIVRKWKYYELNPDFNYNATPIGAGIVVASHRTFYYVIGIIVAVAAIAYVLTIYNGSGAALPNAVTTQQPNVIISQPQSGAYVPVSLTDPPIVPSGTESLIINYSSVALHVNSKAGSDWVESNTSGTIDLMSLLNVSQVIAGLTIVQNSTIDDARFSINSATITINGTIYNVTVPNGEITTRVVENGTVNSISGVLVDLSPTVVAITTNSTTVFVLVPSVKAVVIPNANTTANSSVEFKVGKVSKLSAHDANTLANLKPSISITNASIATYNSNSSISITVKNTGNMSISLTNILLVGNQTPVIVYGQCAGASRRLPIYLCNMPSVEASANENANINARAGSLRSIGAQIGHATSDIGSVIGQVTSGVGSQVGQATSSVSSDVAASASSSSSNGKFAVTANINSSSSNGRSDFATNASSSASIGRFNVNNDFVHVYSGTGEAYGIPVHINANINSSAGRGLPVNFKVSFPWSINVSLGSNITVNGTALYHLVTPFSRGNTSIIPYLSDSRGIEFLVNSNGTLTMSNQQYAYQINNIGPAYQGSGDVLSPGKSATLTFNGVLALPADLEIALVPGANYHVEALGSNGVSASLNVTAT